MSRYVDAEYIKAVMINDRLLQGNAEFTLYEQQVDIWVKALPSIDIVRCVECRYASDDGTYGCMYEHFNDTSDAYHRMWSGDFCSRGERKDE